MVLTEVFRKSEALFRLHKTEHSESTTPAISLITTSANCLFLRIALPIVVTLLM